MGYSLTIEPDLNSGDWDMVLHVRLSREEASDLFLAGDAMVAWPSGRVEGEDPGLERSSMFLSEIAARSAGLRIHYPDRFQVERAAIVVRARLSEAGLGEELE